MIIHGRKVYAAIKPVSDKYLICAFSEELTQEAVIDHQYRMLYSEQIFNIVFEITQDYCIYSLPKKLDRLKSLVSEYECAAYSAKRNSK